MFAVAILALTGYSFLVMFACVGAGLWLFGEPGGSWGLAASLVVAWISGWYAGPLLRPYLLPTSDYSFSSPDTVACLTRRATEAIKDTPATTSAVEARPSTK